MNFNKPPITFEQQLDLLIQRGLVVSDRQHALHYLSHLNYYRLGAYWLPFEADHNKHQFKKGTTFDVILSLYVFDRELRLLVLDAIERIEVSIRTQWAYHLSHQYGSHAHLNSELFKPRWNHQRNTERLKEDVKISQEVFIQHLRNKYKEDLPPLWACCEIMTLGQLSKWVANLRHGRDRNKIAHAYDMDETNLVSFLHHLSTVRNLCAHHSRLWNRDFTFTYKMPRKRPKVLLTSLNPGTPRKIYNTLVMLAYLLDVICPNHHWKSRLLDLIRKHQTDCQAMGFPVGYEKLPIWQV